MLMQYHMLIITLRPFRRHPHQLKETLYMRLAIQNNPFYVRKLRFQSTTCTDNQHLCFNDAHPYWKRFSIEYILIDGYAATLITHTSLQYPFHVIVPNFTSLNLFNIDLSEAKKSAPYVSIASNLLNSLCFSLSNHEKGIFSSLTNCPLKKLSMNSRGDLTEQMVMDITKFQALIFIMTLTNKMKKKKGDCTTIPQSRLKILSLDYIGVILTNATFFDSSKRILTLQSIHFDGAASTDGRSMILTGIDFVFQVFQF
ncbi:hypothetical protein BCR42DRAFT_397249 [Absidia repens]|uniref:Uncharacterized protein n=1 Tax=Absidia repens TaxID=90262 RepID=A0A1X2I2X2_9FUNG|nr:hypothetical protein BCR42DRAFT_397249 [Absidia repens]